ncbi:isoprenoid synthase domain-containing protein, partial [Mycena epipterygia]
LPDLAAHCTFSYRTNPSSKGIPAETKTWFFNGNAAYYEKQCESLNGLNPTLLAAVVYPDAGRPQLRVCSDFLAYLFLLDDLSDDLQTSDTASVADVVLNSFYHPHKFQSQNRLAEMSKDLMRRIQQTSSDVVQRRFIETFDFWLQSVNEQARDRTSGTIPTLDDYITKRRDNSACKPCFVMIQYVSNLEISDEIMDHPVIRGMGEATNDLVAWSNDLFSYSVEHAKGDTHNMINILMHHNGLDLFAAAEVVAKMCREAIDRFMSLKAELPSWDESTNRDVTKYVQGLADWIVGILHWSFATERYFGKAVKKVKATMVVEIV